MRFFDVFRRWLPDDIPPGVALASLGGLGQEDTLFVHPGFGLRPGASIRGDLVDDFEKIEAISRLDHQPPQVALLSGGTVLGNGWSIIAKPGYLLNESRYLSHKSIRDFSRVLDPDLGVVETEVDDELLWIVGSNSSSHNYWHWNAQVLPAIVHSIDFAEAAGFQAEWRVLTQPLEGFQQESLRLLGIDQERVREVKPNEVIRARQLVYSAYLASAFFPGVQRSGVANRIRDSLRHETGSTRRKTYLARTDTNRRRIENETELIGALEAEGFDCVTPGELSFSEQVVISAESEVIIGPHGAGMANLLFAPEGGRALEVGRSAHLNPANLTLGMTRGLTYWLDLFPSTGERHRLTGPVDVNQIMKTVAALSA
jgi:hypothetical protein